MYCGRRWNNKSRRGERGNSNYYRRLFILERGGVCERCGGEDGLEVHHIVPVAHGGPHVPSNVLVLCRGCHRGEHPARIYRSPEVEPESELGRRRKVAATHHAGCRCLNCTMVGRS